LVERFVYTEDVGGSSPSSPTIKQKLQNVKTIFEWARKSSLGKLFPHENPLAVVQMPEIKEVSSEQRTLTLAEARKVLTMARSETSPEKRWLPWLCAYSGARINEVNRSGFFGDHQLN
jgi:integrase